MELPPLSTTVVGESSSSVIGGSSGSSSSSDSSRGGGETMVAIRPLVSGGPQDVAMALPRVEMRVQDAVLLYPSTKIKAKGWRSRWVSWWALWRSPSSRLRKTWNLAIILLVVFQAVTLPVRLGFRGLWTSTKTYIGLSVVDYASDMLFWVDMVLTFYTPYTEGGVYVVDKAAIRAKYLHTWFALDLIATLPYDFAHWGFWQHAALRLPRLLRGLKYNVYLRVLQQRTSHQSLFRFARLFFAFLLTIHVLACVYMAISYDRGFGATAWLARDDVQGMSTAAQYLYAYFWATNQLTNKGGGIIRPVTLFEMGVELIIALMALFGIATIIGAISRIIAQLDMSGEKFRQKMLEVNLFMRNRKLPPELADRIRDHYIALWSRHGGLDTSHILKELPVTLRTHVAMFLNRELFSKVPLFNAASTGFVESLAPYLQPQIFSPGDVVIREGSTGSEMFFISRGTVKIIQQGEVINTLHQGAYFGELSLLVPETPRTATVQTVSYCDLFVLSKADMTTVLKNFPREEAIMMKKAMRLKFQAVLRSQLAKEPVFADMTEKFLIDLRDAFKLHSYRSTEDVFTAGRPVDSLHFIAQGWVQLMHPDGRLGRQLGPMSLVGGVGSGVEDETWPGTGRAGAQTMVMSLSLENYESFCNSHMFELEELGEFACSHLVASVDPMVLDDVSASGVAMPSVPVSGGGDAAAAVDGNAQLERVVPLLGDIASLMTGSSARFMHTMRHDALQLDRLTAEQLLLASEALSSLSVIVTSELFARRTNRKS